MKKVWPVVVVALLALAAYAQAHGLTRLVAAELEVARPARLPSPAAELHTPAADAAPILDRNVFDSETGPLGDERDAPVTPSPAPTAEIATAAPACDFGEVTLIVDGDPQYAFASITTANESRLYAIGDAVADRTVHDIGWDRVWFASEAGSCQMRLGDKLKTKAPRARKAKKKKKKKEKGKKGKKGPTPVPDHIAQRIQQLGPQRYAIERSAFDAVFEMDNGLVRGTRVRPVKDGDRVVGMSFNGRGVAEGSLLHSIGIRAGDVLKSVNGFQPTTPQKALEAYGRLKTSDALALVLERDGKSMTIEYDIQ